MTEISADKSDPVKRPRSWDKALKAAGMRLLGASQAEAAKTAGIGERTLQRYEKCSWWPEAEKQAREKWLDDVRAAAYRSLLKLVRGTDEMDPDPKTVRWTLERIDEQFIPPKQRIEQDVTADVTERDDSDNMDLSKLDDEDLDELERIRRKMNAESNSDN